MVDQRLNDCAVFQLECDSQGEKMQLFSIRPPALSLEVNHLFACPLFYEEEYLH